MTNRDIPKNEVINHNIDALVSDEFKRNFSGRIEDGKKIQSFVDMGYNDVGELKFRKYDSNLKKIRFYIDATYIFKRSMLSCFFPGKNKWTIFDLCYFNSNTGEDVKQVIESAVDYVNKMSKEERERRNDRKNN